MTKEIYTFQRMARVIDESIVDFPISFYETKAGTLCPETYHDHEFIELVLVTAGTGIHVVDGRRAEIREGDVLLLYPHATHGYVECGTLGLLNIMYDPTKLPLPVLDGERLPFFRHFFPRDLEHIPFQNTPEPILHIDSQENLELISAEMRLLCQELTSHQAGNMLASIIRLLPIFLSVLRFGQPLIEDEAEMRVFSFGKILEYINKNFTQNISMDDLVKMSAYSQSAFQRKFKHLTGYGVTEYILRKRIALAQTLLVKEPDRSIGEIGYMCGFIDGNYFSRKFRIITGMTPREWRLSNGKK